MSRFPHSSLCGAGCKEFDQALRDRPQRIYALVLADVIFDGFQLLSIALLFAGVEIQIAFCYFVVAGLICQGVSIYLNADMQSPLQRLDDASCMDGSTHNGFTNDRGIQALLGRTTLIIILGVLEMVLVVLESLCVLSSIFVDGESSKFVPLVGSLFCAFVALVIAIVEFLQARASYWEDGLALRNNIKYGTGWLIQVDKICIAAIEADAGGPYVTPTVFEGILGLALGCAFGIPLLLACAYVALAVGGGNNVPVRV